MDVGDRFAFGLASGVNGTPINKLVQTYRKIMPTAAIHLEAIWKFWAEDELGTKLRTQQTSIRHHRICKMEMGVMTQSAR